MPGHMQGKKTSISTTISSTTSTTNTTTSNIPTSLDKQTAISTPTSSTTSNTTATTTTIPLNFGESLREGQCQYTCEETGGCKTELVINNNSIDPVDITHPW